MSFQLKTSGPQRAVLGIDTGFEFIGWGLVSVEAELLDFGLIRTVKSSKKQNLLAATDNRRRAMEIANGLEALWAACSAFHIVAVGLEQESLVRNASVTFKMGLGFGVTYAFLQRHGLVAVEFSPQDLKLATTGQKTATKPDMLRAVRAKNQDRFDYLRDARKIPAGQMEHPVDGVAVAYAALASDWVRMALR